MSHDDPFDPSSDPYPEPPEAPAVSRRAWLALAAATPIACAVACAAPRRLVCAPRPGDDEHCTARFCRYYRG